MSGSVPGPPGGPQSMWSEDNVAERVRLEREARKWSTATLAERMSDAGFPINQSAIWRIESAEPRRRINLDEAIGFAQVFGIDLDNLLGPPQLAMHERAVQLIDDVRTSYRAIRAANDQLAAAQQALETYIDAHPEIEDEVGEAVSQVIAEELVTPGPFSGPPLVHFGHPPNTDEEDDGPTSPSGE
ncbi:multiprotein-bridging factor 1 family protein [Embleya sp. NPDC020886]|uniref:multiprotein-bridging factor 1 family protein n=1 Tax=Embleya sp. NPDC020886 TaxID=3363980 RepID=UPI0037AD154B